MYVIFFFTKTSHSCESSINLKVDIHLCKLRWYSDSAMFVPFEDARIPLVVCQEGDFGP